MRLFSEKVHPTFVNSPLNIIQVKEFHEIFFDVYEIEINSAKYPADKIADYNGNPIVSIPVVIEGVTRNYPFVLCEGEFSIIFNENNTIDQYTDDPELLAVSDSSDIPVLENIEEVILDEVVGEDCSKISLTDISEDRKNEILEQIQEAKRKASEELKRLQAKKANDLKKQTTKNAKVFEDTLENAKEALVEQFLSISDKIKEGLLSEQDVKIGSLERQMQKDLLAISKALSEDIDDNFEDSAKNLDKRIRQVVKEIYNKFATAQIKEDVDNIRSDIYSELAEFKAETVELDGKITKGVNKALSRIGNVSTKVDTAIDRISESVDEKISNVSDKITTYYDDKITILEESLNGYANKNELLKIVNESKESLLETINELKGDESMDFVMESGSPKKKTELEKFQKEFDQKITTKIDEEVVRMRKYVVSAGGGGGTVAQQFADGGTMNGDLIINGDLSATTISLSSGDIGDLLSLKANLSGADFTGNITTTGNVGIGTTSPAGTLQLTSTGSATPLVITKTAETGVRERLLTATVTDDATSNFFINNGTISNGLFAPVIGGYSESSTVWPLGFAGYISATADVSDSSPYGLTDIAAFRTTNGADALNGTLSPIQNRKIFTVRNFANIALTVTANTNVGIGTTSPAEKLDVEGNAIVSGTLEVGDDLAVNGTIEAQSSSFPVLKFDRQASLVGSSSFDDYSGIRSAMQLITTNTSNMGQGFGGGIVFAINDNAYNAGNGGQARIYARRDSADDKGALQFGVGQDGELIGLTIRDNGNVGIGITDPSNLLTLSDDSATGTRFDFVNTDTGGVTWRMNSSGSGNTGGAGNFLISQDGVGIALMLQKSTGNVGIGTIAPAEKLDVEGNAVISGTLEAQGNVGIGTTNPTEELEVVGTIQSTAKTGADNIWLKGINSAGATIGMMREGSNVGGGGLAFTGVRIGNSGAGVGFSAYAPNNADSAIQFNAVGGTLDSATVLSTTPLLKIRKYNGSGFDDMFTIGNAGNVGIGTNSPARKLHVSDAMRLEPTSTPSSPSEGDLYFDSTSKKLRCYDGTTWQDCF